MRGTRITIAISWLQTLLVVGTWLAGILLLVLAALWITNQLVAIVLAGIVLAVCWMVTFRIMRSPAGKPQAEISTYEGLRGAFTIHQIGLYLLLIPAVGLTIVAIGLLSEQSSFTNRPLLFLGIGGLIAVGWPVALIVGRVNRFRVDQHGQLWVSRWGREEALHVAEFAQVRGYVVHARRAVIPRMVVCSGGRGRLRRVVFTLDHIAARDHGTQVPAGVLDAFLQEACVQAGLVVRSVGTNGKQGWIASAAMRSQHEDR
ncbi:MAG: hypothetical protein SH847_04150 [Roseiflexaceae bacterium]|nr:hypothetical protein [Roseiflexaceae bacterium]